MALSIQAGTGLCCWGSGCERGAEEGEGGLDMDARLGAKGILDEVEILEAGALMVDGFPCDITDEVGC